MFLTIFIMGMVKRIFSFANTVQHMKIILDLVQNDFKNADYWGRKIFNLAYIDIYQMATMVTTVGYGDGISTPDLPSY